MKFQSNLIHLECSKTGKKYEANQLHNLSKAGAPLIARYDLDEAAKTLQPDSLSGRRRDIWRYHEVMPLPDKGPLLSLGEGGTPMHHYSRMEREIGFSQVYIKDESVNPTGSFKARGISAAVNAALDRGVQKFAIPTAGNAGGALACYAALAGKEAHIFMPDDTPMAFRQECISAGANLYLIDGLITDCGKKIAELKDKNGWFDVSTLKEPYRLEGKKTMGYEIFEDLDNSLPDVIIYPTGGGTGLIGMWKAFQEMEEMGWIGKERPRLISVQAAGCAPITQAWIDGKDAATLWPDAHTCASGLRVPAAVADFLILQAIRETHGCALSVTDEDMMAASHRICRETGIFPAPEGGAVLAAFLQLADQGAIHPKERVVLFNTGSGYKYLEAFQMHPVGIV